MLMAGTADTFGGMSQSDQQVSGYRFRIVLRRISPHIWRRVVVRSDSTLEGVLTLSERFDDQCKGEESKEKQVQFLETREDSPVTGDN